MNIYKNFSLKNFNTFSVNVNSKFFVEIQNLKELKSIFNNSKFFNIPKLIIGEGSNILFTKNFNGLVVKISLKGISIIKLTNKDVLLKISSGVLLNDAVKWSINNNFGGMENLSYIPGTIGAAPINNVGAYGVEIKDILFCVEVYEINTGSIIKIYRENINLDYRNSSFREEWKNKYIIISVFLILKKIKYNKLNISYNIVKEELKYNLKINKKPSAIDISKAIINIRKRILVNPNYISNAGSFFKNPIIDIKVYFFIKKKNPDIIGYDFIDNKIKLSANQLIEKIGFKGKRIGQVGTYNKKGIILLNYGKATGEEIYNFSQKIINKIKKKFGVLLEREVVII